MLRSPLFFIIIMICHMQIDASHQTSPQITQQLGSLSLTKQTTSGKKHKRDEKYDSSLDTNLIAAATAGNLSEVQKLINEQNANPNAMDWYNCTPLFHTCGADHLDIVTFLLGLNDNDEGEQIVDINAHTWESGTNPTPLALASSTGKLTITYLLASHPYIKLNAVNIKGKTALAQAIESYRLNKISGHSCNNLLGVITILLKTPGIGVDIRFKDDMTPLMFFLKNNLTYLAQLAVKAKSNLALCDIDGNSALAWAAKMNNTVAMNTLLVHEAPVTSDVLSWLESRPQLTQALQRHNYKT